MKRFEKWSTVFVSVFAENSLNCVAFFLVCLLGEGGGGGVQPLHLMSESKELKPPENTITHRLNIMDCIDRIRQTEVILLISCSGYDERLMWSMCFATD